MKLDLGIWRILSGIVDSSTDMPHWLKILTRMSLKEVEDLPELDETSEGEVAVPYITTNFVTEDYLDFLHGQIHLGARGTAWIELIQARFDAWKPYLGQGLIVVTFYKKPDVVSISLDAKTKKLVHIEKR